MEVLPELQEQRLVIAIDYGTTYTGVAWATPVGYVAKLNEITVVQDWGHGMGNHQKIPSVISYSLSRNRERQWGADLSPQAIAMVHTKLQLDVDDTTTELDLILDTLDGMHNLDFRYIRDSGGEPKFTRNPPEQIVEDYMAKVFDYLLEKKECFAKELRERIVTDIVVTIPAEWHYRAKNSTFRAINRAGFNKEYFPLLNEVLLISEPEAAAIYTARFLTEYYGANFLRTGECFVLCDAGGGTVDVVSYKVNQLQTKQTKFEIERATIPTGYKCGSIFINVEFKKWLRELLGPELYRELDQERINHNISSHDAEGERMRELMKRFDVYKRKFHKDHKDIHIDLPAPFEKLDLEDKVVGGQITITNGDMQSFFEPRVDRIIELIQGQLEQIENERSRRPKNVFLVGGFAESKYLQQSIEESLAMRQLELRIPDTSWTAVVRGATIFGIEKPKKKPLVSMTECPRNYGISFDAPYSDALHNTKDHHLDVLSKTAMAKDQLTWMIKKGDLILSDKPKEVQAPLTINFTANDSRTGSITVYSYDSVNDLPERLFNARNELTKCFDLEYNLRDIPLLNFHCRQERGRPNWFVADLYVSMKVVQATRTLQAELFLSNKRTRPLDSRHWPIEEETVV